MAATFALEIWFCASVRWWPHRVAACCKLESTLLLAIFSLLSCTIGPVTVDRVGSPVSLFENKWSQDAKCIFKGRPRPQITWYKDGSNLKTFNNTEVETLLDNGIFQVNATLHVPGRKEFEGKYFCSGNNSLSSGWSSSKEPEDGIEVSFKCKQPSSSPIANNWQFKQRRRQGPATTRTTPQIINMTGWTTNQPLCCTWSTLQVYKRGSDLSLSLTN